MPGCANGLKAFFGRGRLLARDPKLFPGTLAVLVEKGVREGSRGPLKLN